MKKLKPEERAALGQSGGHARARNLTKKQLSEIGKKAAAARWGKRKKESS